MNYQIEETKQLSLIHEASKAVQQQQKETLRSLLLFVEHTQTKDKRFLEVLEKYRKGLPSDIKVVREFEEAELHLKCIIEKYIKIQYMTQDGSGYPISGESSFGGFAVKRDTINVDIKTLPASSIDLYTPISIPPKKGNKQKPSNLWQWYSKLQWVLNEWWRLT